MSEQVRSALDQRAKEYGSYLDKCVFIQQVKDLVRVAPSWHDMDPDQRETVDMVIHKISRAIYGDPNKLDTWIDIAGYSQLIVDRLEKENAKNS